MSILLLLLGLAVGFGVGLLVAQGRGLTARDLQARDRQLLELADSRFREASTKAGGDLDRRQSAVEQMVGPLRDTLGRVEGQLHELERVRLTAYTSLTEQVSFARQASEQLREQTSSLVNALKAPQARGRWGEMQLRRVVEMAGMVEHCDFTEQTTVTTDDGVLRPDLVVRLAGGKQIVVDAKVSLAAYLQAVESKDDDVTAERMQAHARHLRAHVDGLAAKDYWRAFQPTPEFVVLFVPGDAFLAPALEHDPALLEHAMNKRVLITTPTTLMAMLRTVAYAWQQDALTAHARQVFELGQELYRRLGGLGGHVDKLGRSLSRTVEDYNRTVGSLERTVLSQARKMAELHVTDADLPVPTPLDDVPRPLGAPELLASAEEARSLRSVSGG
ncbi:MAG: DNA recombination protein RmuC [Nocardioidaceae bacterium]